MKTAKEFFERIQNDEAFAKEIAEACQAKRDAGATNYYETIIPVAEERGYEVTEENLDSIVENMSSELSEEELGKVAGGTSCIVVFYMVGSLVSVTIATATVTKIIDEIF